MFKSNKIIKRKYPDLATSNKQQKKQWKYVSNREIEYVVSKAENEVFTLKSMSTAEQEKCNLNQLVEALK